MTTPYIHVLADVDPGGPDGQYICGECKLEGLPDLEGWENFLNGEWVIEEPDMEGDYPVLLHVKQEYAIRSARPAKNRKGSFVWTSPKTRTQVRKRWSLPIPKPPKEG